MVVFLKHNDTQSCPKADWFSTILMEGLTMVSKTAILDALRNVYDPEIGINIVDVGLVYRAEPFDDHIEIDFTLTSPGCPLADSIELDIQNAVKAATEVQDIRTQLVWSPAWSLEFMSEEARLELGYPI